MAEYEFYDGASTGQQIDDMVQKGIVTVNCGTITSLPFTKSSAYITADHVVLNAVLGSPSAQTGSWTVTTSEGSLQISGNISGSTTCVLTLGLRGASV